MSVFAVMALAGPGIGCVAAGWIEQNPHLEWRLIQWLHVMCVRPRLAVDDDCPKLTPALCQSAWRAHRWNAYLHERDKIGGLADAAREEVAQGDRGPALPRSCRGRAR